MSEPTRRSRSLVRTRRLRSGGTIREVRRAPGEAPFVVGVCALDDEAAQREFDHVFWQRYTSPAGRMEAAFDLARRAWGEAGESRLDRTVCGVERI